MANPKIYLPQALHILEERYVDVASHLKELRTLGRDGQPARCPFCRRAAMIVETDEELGLQFFHRQHFSSSPCLLTSRDVPPAVLFARGIPDAKVENQNRAAFLAQWRSHFAVMADQVRTLSIERFVNLVSAADVLHLWSYSDLNLNDVPYILLVLAELMADTTVAGEKMWVRFVFEGRIKSVSDLWAEPELKAKLYRIQYRPHKNTRMPIARHIAACVEVERTALPSDIFANSIFGSDEATLEELLQAGEYDVRGRRARLS